VQGVIKAYDPATRTGTVVRDADLAEYDLSDNALDGSVFRMLRQGQRVLFDLDNDGRATRLHLGSEIDMGTPEFLLPPGERASDTEPETE
jgi:hypothetical protein